MRLPVDADIGRAILAEIHGLVNPYSRAIDLMAAAISAMNASPRCLRLVQEGASFQGELAIRTELGIQTIALDPGSALLAACRMDLPLFVPDPPGSEDIPAVYHSLLDGLDL